eukprot:TRINITY_DN3193_c4_g5_i2.p1 TRINITY_DN3193_c4_g5~~TRINITY_DN3193_c4_g5_i2.p1  ORF type:complete len:1026 (-),score=265.84 TRINITY_DN3193_c4_g5_i2:230-3145(-)
MDENLYTIIIQSICSKDRSEHTSSAILKIKGFVDIFHVSIYQDYCSLIITEMKFPVEYHTILINLRNTEFNFYLSKDYPYRCELTKHNGIILYTLDDISLKQNYLNGNSFALFETAYGSYLNAIWLSSVWKEDILLSFGIFLVDDEIWYSFYNHANYSLVQGVFPHSFFKEKLKLSNQMNIGYDFISKIDNYEFKVLKVINLHGDYDFVAYCLHLKRKEISLWFIEDEQYLYQTKFDDASNIEVFAVGSYIYLLINNIKCIRIECSMHTFSHDECFVENFNFLNELTNSSSSSSSSSASSNKSKNNFLTLYNNDLFNIESFEIYFFNTFLVAKQIPEDSYYEANTICGHIFWSYNLLLEKKIISASQIVLKFFERSLRHLKNFFSIQQIEFCFNIFYKIRLIENNCLNLNNYVILFPVSLSERFFKIPVDFIENIKRNVNDIGVNEFVESVASKVKLGMNTIVDNVDLMVDNIDLIVKNMDEYFKNNDRIEKVSTFQNVEDFIILPNIFQLPVTVERKNMNSFDQKRKESYKIYYEGFGKPIRSYGIVHSKPIVQDIRNGFFSIFGNTSREPTPDDHFTCYLTKDELTEIKNIKFKGFEGNYEEIRMGLEHFYESFDEIINYFVNVFLTIENLHSSSSISQSIINLRMFLKMLPKLDVKQQNLFFLLKNECFSKLLKSYEYNIDKILYKVLRNDVARSSLFHLNGLFSCHISTLIELHNDTYLDKQPIKIIEKQDIFKYENPESKIFSVFHNNSPEMCHKIVNSFNLHLINQVLQKTLFSTPGLVPYSSHNCQKLSSILDLYCLDWFIYCFNSNPKPLPVVPNKYRRSIQSKDFGVMNSLDTRFSKMFKPIYIDFDDETMFYSSIGNINQEQIDTYVLNRKFFDVYEFGKLEDLLKKKELGKIEKQNKYVMLQQDFSFEDDHERLIQEFEDFEILRKNYFINTYSLGTIENPSDLMLELGSLAVYNSGGWE